MICTLCSAISTKLSLPPMICQACETSLQHNAIQHTEDFGGVPVRILFSYDGFMRDLIVRAKVKNDAIAVEIIMKMIRQQIVAELSNNNHQMNHKKNLVLPAPSSLWGRVRGRFNLAKLMAEEFFPEARHGVHLLPGSFWRKKRAGRNQSQRSNDTNSLKFIKEFGMIRRLAWAASKISQYEKILIVDDVLTTGFTIKSIIDQLRLLGAVHIEGLVVASSSSTRYSSLRRYSQRNDGMSEENICPLLNHQITQN